MMLPVLQQLAAEHRGRLAVVKVRCLNAALVCRPAWTAAPPCLTFSCPQMSLPCNTAWVN